MAQKKGNDALQFRFSHIKTFIIIRLTKLQIGLGLVNDLVQLKVNIMNTE